MRLDSYLKDLVLAWGHAWHFVFVPWLLKHMLVSGEGTHEGEPSQCQYSWQGLAPGALNHQTGLCLRLSPAPDASLYMNLCSMPTELWCQYFRFIPYFLSTLLINIGLHNHGQHGDGHVWTEVDVLKTHVVRCPWPLHTQQLLEAVLGVVAQGLYWLKTLLVPLTAGEDKLEWEVYSLQLIVLLPGSQTSKAPPIWSWPLNCVTAMFDSLRIMPVLASSCLHAN